MKSFFKFLLVLNKMINKKCWIFHQFRKDNKLILFLIIKEIKKNSLNLNQRSISKNNKKIDRLIKTIKLM